MTTRPGRPELDRTVVAGLAAGGLGALVASLVSLLVRSPDPDVANTATVSTIAFLVGIAAGLAWWAFGDRALAQLPRIAAGVGGAVIAVGVVAIFDAAVLDGLLGYGILPAVAVPGVVVAALPWFGRPTTPLWLENVTAVAAVVAGAFLAGLS